MESRGRNLYGILSHISMFRAVRVGSMLFGGEDGGRGCRGEADRNLLTR